MSGEYEFDVTNGSNRGHVIGHIPFREAGREFFMSVRMHRWLGPTTPVPPMEQNTLLMFSDRYDAGDRLAKKLLFLANTDCVIVGLPRGGVPVAFQVAQALHAPLDVVVVRKLGLPENPEVAAGAIAEGGVRETDNDLVSRARVDDQALRGVEQREREAVRARVERLRHGRDRIDLKGRTVVIVDDGIATGATARVACQAVRRQEPDRVILAVPVAPPEVIHNFPDVDAVVCLLEPTDFWAVGQFYVDFSETTDDEVSDLLDRANASTSS